MLTPCSPCLCTGAPCEQCMFGYITKEDQHFIMLNLFKQVERGKKPSGYVLVDRYKRYHPDWEKQIEESEEEKKKMIITGDTKCEECIHKHVCKMDYQQDFINAKREIEKIEESISEIFEINIKCKEFRKESVGTRRRTSYLEKGDD